MNFRKLLLIAAAIVAAAACKKDDEETLTPALNGLLTYYMPDFVEPGKVYKMTPKGVKHPEGKELGYYWKVSPSMSVYDTTRYLNGLNKYGEASDGSFTHVFPDSLKTFTVYCYAYATGYSGLSASRYAITVKGGYNGSINGLERSLTDLSYDGDLYFYDKVGDQTWTLRNLATKGSGAAYGNFGIMSDVFGRYYSYDEAVAACAALPNDGTYTWALPTEDDWIALGKHLGSTADRFEPIPGIAAKLMADATFNDEKMWEYWPEVGKITNQSKLSFMPTGYANLGDLAEDGTYPDAKFNGIYEYAAYWTATEVEGEPENAYYRYIVCDQGDFFSAKGNKKSFGASVRCIQKAN